MTKGDEPVIPEVGSRAVAVTHPDQPLMPAARVRQIDLVRYDVAAAEGALRDRSSSSCRVRIVLARVPERLRPPPVSARAPHAPKTRASS